MIFGVDTHNGYGRIDAAKMAAAGVRFVYAKCSEGNKNTRAGAPYKDEQFDATVAACDAVGIPVGPYHYGYCLPDHPKHPGRSPEEEAERAFALSGGVGARPGDLAPVLDAEHPEPTEAAGFGCTRPQISDWLRRWCVRATALWGRKPVIYTYPNWWRWLAAGADVSWAREYLLWFANYAHLGEGMPADGTAPPLVSWVAGTWDDWAVWQFSANGSAARVPGINACPVDRNCIRSETMLLVLRGLYKREDAPFDIVTQLPDTTTPAT